MGLARVADALTHLRDTTPQDVPANPSQVLTSDEWLLVSSPAPVANNASGPRLDFDDLQSATGLWSLTANCLCMVMPHLKSPYPTRRLSGRSEGSPIARRAGASARCGR